MQNIVDPVEVLRASEKFRQWKRPPYVRSQRTELRGERHYSPAEIAKEWAVSVQTVREIFKDEEGVLKIGRTGTRSRRRYMTLRIPESIVERVHTRLSA
jgi:hypothetical protein